MDTNDRAMRTGPRRCRSGRPAIQHVQLTDAELLRIVHRLPLRMRRVLVTLIHAIGCDFGVA